MNEKEVIFILKLLSERLFFPVHIRYALGGFGCSPGSRGRAVYFEDLFSGKRCRWDRTDILGIADREKLPDWAKEKAEEYEQHRTAQKKERGEER